MSPRHFSGNRYSPAFKITESGHREVQKETEDKIENFFNKFKFWTYFKKKSN
jgi:hypothetical protein